MSGRDPSAADADRPQPATSALHHLAVATEADQDGPNQGALPVNDFASRHVSIHGHDVRYRMAGSGPALLLLHGIAGSSRAWKEVMPRLVDSYTCIAPDMLGHGESAKPMGDYSLGAYASGARDLLVTLGIDRATVVGQSFGGGVAMQFAYQHPEMCERLVLVDAGGLGREVSWLLRAVTLPGSELVMPALFQRRARPVGDSVARTLAGWGIQSPRLAEIWRAFGSLTETENRAAFLRTMRGVIDAGGQTVSAMDRLYLAAHLPTLIVWGDQDWIIPVEHAHHAHEAMPGSELVIMPGVGHFPHSEQPEQFAEILRGFLERTEPAHLTTEEFRRTIQIATAAESGDGPHTDDLAS